MIMSNESNLKPLSTDKAREIGSKGGKASVEARRRKKDLRLALEMLLEKNFTDKSGNQITGTEAITAKLFEQAMKGNVKAFETIRATVGQDPVQKVEVAKIEKEQSLQELQELFDEDE